MGTRFAATIESSANDNYKKKIIEANDTSTTLVLRKIGNARIIKNEWSELVKKAEENGASEDELKKLLGEKRERLGIFEGNEKEGMMEVGQGVGLIKEILPVEDLMKKLIDEYDLAIQRLISLER